MNASLDHLQTRVSEIAARDIDAEIRRAVYGYAGEKRMRQYEAADWAAIQKRAERERDPSRMSVLVGKMRDRYVSNDRPYPQAWIDFADACRVDLALFPYASQRPSTPIDIYIRSAEFVDYWNAVAEGRSADYDPETGDRRP